MGEIAGLGSIAELMRNERAAAQIAKARGHVTSGMSGEQLLGLMDKAIPGTKLGGQIGQRLWTNLGVKSATRREAFFPDAPYAYVILGLFCACAREDLAIEEINEPEPGAHALIATAMPSSILALAGEVLLDVQATDHGGFAVTGQTVVKGQLLDFGRGKRLLDTVFDRAAQAIRTFRTLDL